MQELKFDVVQSIGEITANFEEFKDQVSMELEKYKKKEFTEETKKDANRHSDHRQHRTSRAT